MVATGFLHPVELQALLPAEYPTAFSSMEPQASLHAQYPFDYTNCAADPVHDVSCLVAHTVHMVC